MGRVLLKWPFNNYYNMSISNKTGKELIQEEGFDFKYGARPLQRYIQTHIETMIARMILENKAADCLFLA